MCREKPVAGHMTPVGWKQSLIIAGARLAFSFSFSQGLVNMLLMFTVGLLGLHTLVNPSG